MGRYISGHSICMMVVILLPPSLLDAPQWNSFSLGDPESADIIVSHDAPLLFEPPLMRDAHVRDDTWQKVVESRRYLDFVLRTVKPSQWFYGHYHSHYEGNFQGTHYLGLDIAEMTQVC